MADSPIEIRPNPGKQEMFLSSSADIAIYGGAAGGGKTTALLLEPLRNIHNPGFGCVIFRKSFPQIMSSGGLWDEAQKLYPLVGGKASVTPTPMFKFPSGATVRFSHLQYDSSRHDWQGSQIPLIEFDELSHFSEVQFMYMLSRNRSTCGVAPYIRCSTNPDPDCWVRKFLAWWIGADGFPIEERAGVLRWMAMHNNEMRWASEKQELVDLFGDECHPLSVTFVPSKLSDNPKMTDADPLYRGKLQQMPLHERMKLLEGNWDARQVAGSFFQKQWFQFVPAAEAGTKWCRYWDLASTKPNAANPDPDYCVGALIGKQPSGRFVIGDIVRLQDTPHKVELAMTSTASRDGKKVKIVLEQEPGSSGKIAGEYLIGKLAGYNARLLQKRTSKEADWQGLSAQAEAGNVDIVTARWNDDLISELEAVGGPCRHDDQADACSGGFNVIVSETRYTLMYV